MSTFNYRHREVATETVAGKIKVPAWDVTLTLPEGMDTKTAVTRILNGVSTANYVVQTQRRLKAFIGDVTDFDHGKARDYFKTTLQASIQANLDGGKLVLKKMSQAVVKELQNVFKYGSLAGAINYCRDHGLHDDVAKEVLSPEDVDWQAALDEVNG